MKKRCIRAAHEHMLTNVRLLRGRTGNLNRLAVHDSLSVVEGPTGSSEVDLLVSCLMNAWCLILSANSVSNWSLFPASILAIFALSSSISSL